MKAFALALGVVMLTATASQASDNVIPWQGNGSENLPCSSGGHWVLAPAFGVDSAVLTVDGTDYVMTQNGNGSWSADSVGAIDANVDAYVTFTGDGDERNHLQLSHCTDSSPSPSESPSPSDSPSETPSESPSESSSSSTPPTRQVSHTPSEQDPSPSIPPLAETGGSIATPLAIGAVLLALGLGSLFLRRKVV